MNKLLTFFGLLFLAGSLQAQYIVPDYQTYKIDRGQMYIRWEPRSIDEWQQSIRSGYTIEVYIRKSKGKRQLFRTETVRPAPAANWEQPMVGLDSLMQEFYGGSLNLIYLDEQVPCADRRSTGTGTWRRCRKRN